MVARDKTGASNESDFWNLLALLCLVFVLLTSFFTYFYRYQEPQAPFWDENYYITDAEKILNGTFHMQIHPPLGKLLIAAGEALFDSNTDDSTFLDTEHAGEFPTEFSFLGYRFFPALLGWLTAPLLFLCLLLLVRNPLLATLLTFPYLFDNALLVHSRGAMLDSSLNFFFVAAILFFILLTKTPHRKKAFLWLAALLGITIGLAITTKMNGAVLLLLIPTLCIRFRRELHDLFALLTTLSGGFLIVFVSVWFFFLSGMDTIQTELRDEGWFSASEEYKEIIRKGKQSSLTSFPVMLRDHLRYAPEYNSGIPKLDLCKPDENGSPIFLWPFGVTAINYRWASSGENTYRYLYLVANPAAWAAGLAGVLLSAAYLLSPLFGKKRTTRAERDLAFYGTTLLTIYVGYMGAFMLMDRVHFLYSYFPALLTSFLLLGIVFSVATSLGSEKLTEERKILIAMFMACLIFLCFQIYRPLTYYEPITDEGVTNRAIFRLWNLRCVDCEKPSPLVRHQCEV